jgi:hypothetical protein
LEAPTVSDEQMPGGALKVTDRNGSADTDIGKT